MSTFISIKLEMGTSKHSEVCMTLLDQSILQYVKECIRVVPLGERNRSSLNMQVHYCQRYKPVIQCIDAEPN